MKQQDTIVFEKAHFANAEFRFVNRAVYLHGLARLSRLAARAMGAEWSIYDKDDTPKAGPKKWELEFEMRNTLMTFEVSGVGKGPKVFHLELNCPMMDRVVVVKIGGKKKAKSTYLAAKFRLLVDGREDELLEFRKSVGAGEGKLTITPREEQMPLNQPVLEKADGTAKSNTEIFAVPQKGSEIATDLPTSQTEEPIRVLFDQEIKAPEHYARVRVVQMENSPLVSWWLRFGTEKRTSYKDEYEFASTPDEDPVLAGLEMVSTSVGSGESEGTPKVRASATKILAWVDALVASRNAAPVAN